MKNSGIEWIGEIPDDWNLIKVGSIFQCRNEKVNDTDYPPLSVSKGGVVPQMDSVAKSDANDNRKLVLHNDFVINSRSDRKQSCGYSTLKGSVSLINTVLYTTNNKILLPQYTDYLMKNYGFAEEFYRWGHGIVADLWTTRWQEMKSIVLPIPSIDIQQKIADYLDKKCVAVDRLIENQRAQIEKLKEYKQSVITEAVTRGLDSSAPMKDSGVEWLGKIPSHWITIKNKIIFRNISIKNHGDETVLSLYRDYGVIPKDSRDDNYNVTSLDTDSYKFVKCGDLVINKMKAWQGSLAISDYQGIISPAYYICKVNYSYVTNRFIHHYLRNRYLVELFEMLSSGLRIGQWDLAIEDFLNIEIALPPTLKEQEFISEVIDKKCIEINNLISIKQQKIETLTEYKKSLIYEYVTGKKQVG